MLDDLRRQVELAQTASMLAMASGAQGVDVPQWADVREQFDTWLVAPVQDTTSDRATLTRALGL